jgi:hypothetical protein
MGSDPRWQRGVIASGTVVVARGVRPHFPPFLILPAIRGSLRNCKEPFL